MFALISAAVFWFIRGQLTLCGQLLAVAGMQSMYCLIITKFEERFGNSTLMLCSRIPPFPLPPQAGA